MTIGVLILGARLMRRVTRREPRVVFSEELRPGDALVIRHPES
jgi:hypothetical protein